MDKKTVSRILMVLLVAGAMVAVGVYEYRVGFARGLEMSGKLPAGPPAGYPYPDRGWGFHPFGFVFPLLFFFLIFGLARRLFWGGWGRPDGWRWDRSPAELEEWHRQAHEKMSQQSS